MACPSRAIVLAGGRGSKIWPFAEVRNKCAFPIANVPAIRRLVSSLHESGVDRVSVALGWRSESIRHALRGLPFQIEWISTGCSSPLLAASNALEQTGEDAWIISGDLVVDTETLRAMGHRFAESGAAAVALAAPLGDERAGDWIGCSLRDDFNVEGFPGHPRGGTHRFGGAAIVRGDRLGVLTDSPGMNSNVPVGGMPPVESDLASALQCLVDDGEPVLAVEPARYFVDLDRPWHLLEANGRVLRDELTRMEADTIHPTARIHGSAEIHGRLVLAEGSEIGQNVVVSGGLRLAPGASVTSGALVKGDADLAAAARVRDYALLGGGSSMGPGSLLGHGGEFDGVMLERAYLYHYCEISGVIGAAVDIGAATVCGTLRFDDDMPSVQIQGRREKPTSNGGASYIGDYCRTGVNAILMPGVRIGTYSCVGPGVVVSEDVPERTLIQLKQELIRKPWGPEKYGW